MFGRAIRLPFKAFGIPILLDFSFLLILPILAWMIARNLPQSLELMGLHAPGLLEGPWPYVLGLGAAVGLFCSVLIHEFGHALVARRFYGVRTQSVTLWILGGVASLETIPRERYAEAVIAIAGPITSYVLSVLFYLPHRFLAHGVWPGVQFLAVYLALTNFVLATFNLLPAMPMDGGRVLRSLLALRFSYTRATLYAAGVSKVLAVLMGIFAVLSGNLLLLLLAFFVYLAGSAESRQTTFEELLRGLAVRTLMTRDVRTVTPDLDVAELTQLMLSSHHLGFPVVDAVTGLPVGLVTLRQIGGALPEAKVRDVMVADPPTLPLDSDASAAFRMLTDPNAPHRLLVVEPGGQLAGILTKTDLMHALQIRAVQADASAARGVGRVAWGQ